MRFIGVDIGNSLINIGFFINDVLSVYNIETHPIKSSEEYGIIFRGLLNKIEENSVNGAIISSVVPTHTIIIEEVLNRITSTEPLIVSYKMNTGLKFEIENPQQLGADRIANAVAADELCKVPVAVLDFGTASTISIVGKGSTFIGGAILPGLRLMSESLARGTAQLSEVPIIAPTSVLGKNTINSIQSGLLYGTVGAVERLLDEIEKEIGYNLKIVLTGGYGGLLSKFFIRDFEFIPNLTLKGLEILYKRNKYA